MKRSRSRARRVGLAAVACLSLASCAGCSSGSGDIPDDCKPASQFDTIEPGTLTVAAIQQPPNNMINPSTGEVDGLDGELLTEFATQNCLEIDFQALAGPAAVAAMTEGKADIGGGGWTRTAERAEVMGLSETMYWSHLAVVSESGIASVPALSGRAVGVQGGSLFEKPLAAAIGKDNVKSYQGNDVMLNDLEAGRIDAAMIGGTSALIALKERGADNLKAVMLDQDPQYEKLTQTNEVVYPYTKGNAALGKALDAAVVTAREDGTVARVLAEYGITDKAILEGPK